MLRACVLDFKGYWVKYLPLVEFAYNNNFQASIGMAPYYMGESVELQSVGMKWVNESLVVKSL